MDEPRNGDTLATSTQQAYQSGDAHGNTDALAAADAMSEQRPATKQDDEENGFVLGYN